MSSKFEVGREKFFGWNLRKHAFGQEKPTFCGVIPKQKVVITKFSEEYLPEKEAKSTFKISKFI